MNKKFSERRSGASYLRTENRIAGDGIISDDYSEDSGNPKYQYGKFKLGRKSCEFVTDKYDPSTMNGPVIIVQEGKKKHE